MDNVVKVYVKNDRVSGVCNSETVNEVACTLGPLTSRSFKYLAVIQYSNN